MYCDPFRLFFLLEFRLVLQQITMMMDMVTKVRATPTPMRAPRIGVMTKGLELMSDESEMWTLLSANSDW